MMSQRSKRELAEAIRARYLKASKAEKERILNEFVASTGYHRKYAIRLLNHDTTRRSLKKRPGRKKVYQGEVVATLARIWEICGRICSRRLKPFLPEIIAVLERCQELDLKPEIKTLLLSMSRATIDRCLSSARFEDHHGLSTTKPGSLLKQAIAVRTWNDWDDACPGFEEIDLVAHCGDSVEGQYLNTLTMTEVWTGWTECLALPNKTQQAVFQAIQEVRPRLPFPLQGLDSDKGTEFINALRYRYCQTEQITFTRSRPYRKNDQAHVEQKNWSGVRHTVGYDRLETADELALLKAIYADLRLFINFFQPMLKLVGKVQVDGKTRKQYDQAITPYRRLLASDQVSLEVKARLSHEYIQLNPVALRNSIDANVARLWKLVR